MKNWLLGLMSFVWAIGLLSVVPASAQVTENINADTLWGDGVAQSYNDAGFSKTDPRQTIAKIIKVTLGFLGSIAVILVVLAGFKWMTAAGNEDKIAESKKLMAAAMIGLVIILLSFAITNFVLNAVISSI